MIIIIIANGDEHHTLSYILNKLAAPSAGRKSNESNLLGRVLNNLPLLQR